MPDALYFLGGGLFSVHAAIKSFIAFTKPS
jgi:hypothetical protein